MKPVEVGQYLVIDPRVCHGQLTFKGTRVPVETVLHRLAKGRTFAELHISWPEVPSAAIAEAVQIATTALLERWERRARTAHEPTHSGRPA